jgi:hypothetical protein
VTQHFRSLRHKRVLLVAAALIIIVTLSVVFYALRSPPPQPIPSAFAGRDFLVVTQSGVYLSERDSSGYAAWRKMDDGPISGADLSPNGRMVAYVKLPDRPYLESFQGNAVHILDIVTGQSRSITLADLDGTTFCRGSLYCFWLAWSPDSSALAVLTERQRHILYMLAADAWKPIELAVAASQPYTSTPICGAGTAITCSQPVAVYGELSAKWAARGVMEVSQFTGPFPEELPAGSYPLGVIPADHAYYLNVNNLTKANKLPALSEWTVASTIPPGDKAIMYRSVQAQYEWYVADAKYFQDLDIAALTRIKACDNLCPTAPSIYAASPDGRLFSWRTSATRIGVLNLTSLEVEQFTEENADVLRLPQDWGVGALAWAPNDTTLGMLLGHSENNESVWDIAALDVSCHRGVSLGRVTNVTSSLMAFGLAESGQG